MSMSVPRKETTAIVGAVILTVVLILLVYWGMVKFTDVPSAIAFVLVGGIASILLWGFESRIKHIFRPAPIQPEVERWSLEPSPFPVNNGSLTLYVILFLSVDLSM